MNEAKCHPELLSGVEWVLLVPSSGNKSDLRPKFLGYSVRRVAQIVYFLIIQTLFKGVIYRVVF